MEERIFAAARKLAAEKPLDQIGLSDVARTAGVSWPTVKRHVGSKARLRATLETEQPELSGSHPDTRSRLLAAAARVFAQLGYDGATLDGIAAEANLTKGAVYWHFRGKLELFVALVDAFVADQVEHLAEDVTAAKSTRDPERWLELVLGGALDRARGEGARLFVELAASSREPAVRQRLLTALSVRREAVVALLESPDVQAVLPAGVDAAMLAALVVALLDGAALADVSGAGIDAGHAVSTFSRLLGGSGALESGSRIRARAR